MKRRRAGGSRSEIAGMRAVGRVPTGLKPAAWIVSGVSPSSSQALLEAAADRIALAAILDASGRHREAAATLRQALSVYEGVLGADHYEVAGVLENLAGAAERAGEREQAAAAGARALRIRRAVLGHTHRRWR
jgi:tetratricopeptide (TPR) repeat protein